MNVIKEYRQKRDITQAELADMVGVSKGFMSQIENGKGYCPLWLVVKLAEVLRCSTRTLFQKVYEEKIKYKVRKR